MKKLLSFLLITMMTLVGCGQGFDQKATPKKGEKTAILTTSKGEIKIRLFEDQAPETVKNFVSLSEEGKYDGTIFHRSVKDFVIQGGDFTKRDGSGGHSYKGPGTTIEDEISPELSHIRGAVSMANKGPGTDTAGSQFFIVLPEDGTLFLDGGYAVFGQVYEGMDVVDEIAAVETDAGDHPLEEMEIKKVEIK